MESHVNLNYMTNDWSEDVEVEAKRQLYEQINQSNKNKKALTACKRIGRVYIPAVALTFSGVYLGYGLSQMS